jgi:PAS domain S-box-containing protein
MHENSENRRQFEVLSRFSRDILLAVEFPSGRIVDANQAAVAAYGYSRDELVTLNIRDLREAGTLGVMFEQMGTADTEGLLFETVHRRRDGSTFHVEVSSRGAVAGESRILFSFIRDISRRKRAENDRERLIHELSEALENVKNLRGIFPICASCKKIRNDEGYWEQVEVYLREHTDARFSHGICPECLVRLYPDMRDTGDPDDDKT